MGFKGCHHGVVGHAVENIFGFGRFFDYVLKMGKYSLCSRRHFPFENSQSALFISPVYQFPDFTDSLVKLIMGLNNFFQRCQ